MKTARSILFTERQSNIGAERRRKLRALTRRLLSVQGRVRKLESLVEQGERALIEASETKSPDFLEALGYEVCRVREDLAAYLQEMQVLQARRESLERYFEAKRAAVIEH